MKRLLIAMLCLAASSSMVAGLCPALAGEDITEYPYPWTKPETVKRTAGTWFLGGGPVYQDDLGLSFVFAYQFTNKVTIVAGPTYVPVGRYDDTININHRFRAWNGEQMSIWNITHPGPQRDEWGAQFTVLIPLGQ